MNHLTEIKNKLINEGLCNHCLGRQFAMLGYQLENYERGFLIRDNENITKDIFDNKSIANNLESGGDCFLCEGVFNKVDLYVDLIKKELQQHKINNLLVGTSVTESLKIKEKRLWDEYGSKYSEPLKVELNRLVGKRVLSELALKAEFKRPDALALIDLAKDKIKLKSNSMFVYGMYDKYLRGVSQTVWYRDKEVNSVEEIIAQPFIKASQAKTNKFHGAGREDIDVRCFAGREFVLELIEPKNRMINIEEIADKINQKSNAVRIYGVKETKKTKVKQLKEKRSNKLYRALVRLSNPIDSKKLSDLKEIVGIIKQKTPKRVNHRRSDLLRERKVLAIFYEKIASEFIEIIIKAEAGLYIKELISGDEGRTEPSVSQILDCEAVCDKLDLLSIDKK